MKTIDTGKFKETEIGITLNKRILDHSHFSVDLYTQIRWIETETGKGGISYEPTTRYETYTEALKHAKEDNNHELEAQLMAAILGFGLNADSK